eukprot:gene6705-7467_t
MAAHHRDAGAEIAAIKEGLLMGATTPQGIGAAVQASSTKYSVVCCLEIENYTKWYLTSPSCFLEFGYCKGGPVDITPGYIEGFLAHKNGVTPTGTFGSVSWNINGENRVVVMCVNRLGIGIVDDHVKETTRRIYKHNISTTIVQEYYHSSNPIVYKSQAIVVKAVMGTSHICEARVSILPQKYDDLAKNLKPRITREAYAAVL